MIVNVHMAAKQCCVGHDDVIAELAIVSNMAAGHEKIGVADGRGSVLFFASPVDRHAFAENVSVADDHSRIGAAVADILRLGADHHAGEKMVVLTQGNAAHERDAVFELCAVADFDIGANHAEWTNVHIVADFGAGSIETLGAIYVAMRLSTFPAIGDFFSLVQQYAHHVGVQSMSAAVGYDMPDHVAAGQGQIADQIEHFVASTFITEAQLVIDGPRGIEHQQVGRHGAAPSPAPAANRLPL